MANDDIPEEWKGAGEHIELTPEEEAAAQAMIDDGTLARIVEENKGRRPVWEGA